MAKAFGIVTSTPRRVNVAGMQEYRPAAAFSFLGRYRVIDFPISNLSNSGIDNIQVYLNKQPRSLTEQQDSGRHYNINSKRGRLQLLYHSQNNTNELYNTDVSDFTDNMDYIQRMSQDYVVIVPSYMIYTQDYADLLEKHVESGADITMLYHHVDNAKDHFINCRVISLDKDRRITSLEVNRCNSKDSNIFMDSYVMKKDLFIDLIRKTMAFSATYSMAQMISVLCTEGKLDIRGFAHRGYFASINDLNAYYEANTELLDIRKAEDLFSPDWPIYTKTTDSCPTQIFDGAHVRRSMISNGCLIEGTVENSVIGRGVVIKKGAVIQNSILLAYCTIGEDVHIDRQIIDKWASVTHSKELINPPGIPGYIRRSDIL